MPQSYRLRLGDGSLVSVDLDGLKAWAGDDRALAQAVGTQGWRPLGELLVEEESAARLAQALVPPPPREPVPPPSIVARPRLQVLADDPAGDIPPPAALPPDDGLPIIRMKPPEDEPAERPAPPLTFDREEAEFERDEPRNDRFEGWLLTALETFGGFLSRCLTPLAPLVDGVRLRTAESLEPPRERSEPLARVRLSAPGPAKQRPIIPRVPVQTAPPAISELPTLRFAESREPIEAEDVYAGPDASFAWSPLWIWTRRIVAVGAFAALGTWIFLERDAWLPEAGVLGNRVFTAIDRQVVSRQQSEEQRRAFAEATDRLPGLSGETILLFFARSPRGLVDAGEVFQLAREATDRGLAALAPADAEELRALEREALGALSAAERERVREYERTRARRVIFPFENPHVMDLFARGVNSLSPERREQLRALTQEAVAAGIDAPEPAAPSAAR